MNKTLIQLLLNSADSSRTVTGHGVVTVHSVTSNTLRDAQKRQKPPFRTATLGMVTCEQ